MIWVFIVAAFIIFFVAWLDARSERRRDIDSDWFWE